MKTNFTRNAYLGMRYGNTTPPTPPTTYYIGLFIATPGVSGGGTEVSGTGYARQAVTNNLANFPAVVAGQTSNANAIDFGVAGGAWGTVGWIGIFDALTAGNLHDWAPANVARVVNSGDRYEIGVGELVLQEN